jgi:ribosome-associated protein
VTRAVPDSPPNPIPSDSGGGVGVEIAPGVTIARDALRLQYARSGGPGGQNVNKLNTKAEIWVPVGAIRGLREGAVARLRTAAGSRLTKADEIHLVAEGERSQEGNRLDVLERLREMIVRAKVEPKRRKKTKPSAGAKRRRLDSKKRRGEIKAQRRGDW